jgi:hypothetical protein
MTQVPTKAVYPRYSGPPPFRKKSKGRNQNVTLVSEHVTATCLHLDSLFTRSLVEGCLRHFLIALHIPSKVVLGHRATEVVQNLGARGIERRLVWVGFEWECIDVSLQYSDRVSVGITPHIFSSYWNITGNSGIGIDKPRKQVSGIHLRSSSQTHTKYRQLRFWSCKCRAHISSLASPVADDRSCRPDSSRRILHRSEPLVVFLLESASSSCMLGSICSKAALHILIVDRQLVHWHHQQRRWARSWDPMVPSSDAWHHLDGCSARRPQSLRC